MKTFWFTARVALIFALLLVFTQLATMRLFGRLIGRDLMHEMVALKASEGTLVAERLEHLLEDYALADPEIAAFVTATSAEQDTELALLDLDGNPISCSWECRGGPRGRPHDGKALRHQRDVPCRGRVCAVGHRAPFDVYVPVLHDGQEVATLAMTNAGDPLPSHRRFLAGIFHIGTVAMLGVLALSLYLTLPLRRMRRSMDQVAAGDLDHRVRVRGRDEVASMGRSFNAMADRIQGMIRGQKELAAGVSHELRSPLTRIKMSLELLRGSGAEPARIQEVESEVDALDQMVDELLVASRLDLGASTLKLERADLAELVELAWRRVEQAASERQIEIEERLEPDLPAVEVDRALVLRILGNLFENAVRHGGSGPIELTATLVEDRLLVTVGDRGPGIPEELLGRLFEPFFRADPSRSRDTGGTGLGLMIVRRAVEVHGGTVHAANGPDGGLVVTFDLPTAAP